MIGAANDHGSRANLFEAIAEQAAQATRRQLLLLLILGAAGIGAAWRLWLIWPVMAFAAACASGSVACLGLWEMAGRTRKVGYGIRTATRGIVSALGIVLICLSGMAFLVAILGDPWRS